MKLSRELEKEVKEMFSKSFSVILESRILSSFDCSACMVALFSLRAFETLGSTDAAFQCSFPDDARLSYTVSKSDHLLTDLVNSLARVEDSMPDVRGVFLDGILSGLQNHRATNEENKLLLSIARMYASLAFECGSMGTRNCMSAYFQILLEVLVDRLPLEAGAIASPGSLASLVAKIIDLDSGESIYDPVCRTGGFLVAAVISHHGFDGTASSSQVFGREVSPFASGIARLHLFFLGIDSEIVRESAFSNFAYDEALREGFDAVVANPPFGARLEVPLHDFTQIRIPAKNSTSELVILQHMVEVAKPQGRIVAVMPNGVLFRGGSTRLVRSQLVEQELLRAVILLPPGIFYGTAIGACLLVLEKSSNPHKSVFFVDGSEQFLETNRRRIVSDEGIDRIVKSYRDGSSENGFSRRVPYELVRSNDYDLSVSQYIEPTENLEGVPLSCVIENVANALVEHEKLGARVIELINRCNDRS